jgi:hypothetical protein
MSGTAAAGPSPRAVAVGLAVVLVVLVVVGRLQLQVLAPRPPAPAPPLTAAPTTTIPPVPVAARIKVGSDVVALAAGAGGVWALGGRNLVRVNPDSNQVTAKIRIPRSATFYGAGLVLEAGALWVGTGDRTVRIDARTGQVAGSIRMQVQAAASDGLWSCTTRRQDRPGRLVRVDPRTLAETARITLPRCPAAFVAEPGVVWALDDTGRQLLRVQAAGGRVTQIGLPVAAFSFLPEKAGPAAQIAIGEGAVWVLSDQIETPTRLGFRVGGGVVRIDRGPPG